MNKDSRVTAFKNGQQIASGDSAEINAFIQENCSDMRGVVLFDEVLGDIFAGDQSATPPQRRAGRPALKQQTRDIALRPADWDWLAEQPDGAAATLRRLVGSARSQSSDDPERRDAAYRFIRATCIGLPGYVDAIRALYRAQDDCLRKFINAWPPDLARYIRLLLALAD